MLMCALSHLHSDGLFAFETRNPRWAATTGVTKASPAMGDERGAFALLETRDTEEEGPSYVDAGGREVRVFRTQVYDHVAQVLHWTGEHHWYEDGELKTKRRHVAVRFTFPQELIALLEHHGFEVVRQYGDWNLEPLSASSRSIIVVCRKRS